MLKHDAQGFLSGNSIDLGQIRATWDEMSDDLREIRRVLTQHGNVGRAVAPALARRAGAAIDGAAPSIDESYMAMRATQQAILRVAAKPAVRDSRGRFVSANESDAPKLPGVGGGSGGGGGGNGGEEGRMRALANRLVGAVKESGSGMEEADPVVKAFNEVARPLARGYEMMGGGKEKRQEGLLRRIYGMLTGLRKEESGFNKAANKHLKAIEEKPADNSGRSGNGPFGDLFGGIFNFFRRIPLVGGLMSAGSGLLKGAGRLLGFGGQEVASAGKVAGDAGGAIKETGLLGKAGGLLKGGGKLLKRLPIIGTLLSVGGAAADIFDSENDDSLTRREKDKRAGKAVGSAAGGIGGMAAGAATGAAIGSVVPVIGTAIGGIIGGAVGMFFGDQAGQILGETVGDWVSDLRKADIPQIIGGAWNEVKVTALGTFDWIKSGWDPVIEALQKGWDTAMSTFSAVGETIKKAWGGFVDTTKAGWESFSALFSSAFEALKSLPVIGPALKAAEAGMRKIAEVAGTVKDGVTELGGQAIDAVKSRAGNVWSNAKEFAANMVPQGLKDSIVKRRAMETGADYRQGNISGLDDAHTRALIASTVETESAGGKSDVVNSAGYMGRYQAGAGWLADAGLIKGGSQAVRAAMKADGFTNEYKWGQAGGMTKFLKNADNWGGGMSYDK